VGVLYDRMHSRQIADYGGVINPCRFLPPSWCCLRLPSRPARNLGFVGVPGDHCEFQGQLRYSFLAAVTLVLGAAYTLWLVTRGFRSGDESAGGRAL
jgi:NADH-quinone oxidoreductase subunit M